MKKTYVKYGVVSSELTLATWESQKEEKGEENLLNERIAKNFPNHGRDVNIQVQEAQRTPSKISPKKNIQTHTVIRILSQR